MHLLVNIKARRMGGTLYCKDQILAFRPLTPPTHTHFLTVVRKIGPNRSNQSELSQTWFYHSASLEGSLIQNHLLHQNGPNA